MPRDGKLEEAYEKLLANNLQRVLDFLKFAEAKNGALLTFASAWALASVGMLSGERPLLAGLHTALAVALGLFIAAGSLALASFFPRPNLGWFFGGPRAGPHQKNLLFFDDISSFTASEFLPAVRHRYYPSRDQPFTPEYISDLTVQIYINSQIVSRKLRLFTCGLVLIVFAAVVLLLPLTVWAVRKLIGA